MRLMLVFLFFTRLYVEALCLYVFMSRLYVFMSLCRGFMSLCRGFMSRLYVEASYPNGTVSYPLT
jgi:hypothetical protein